MIRHDFDSSEVYQAFVAALNSDNETQPAVTEEAEARGSSEQAVDLPATWWTLFPRSPAAVQVYAAAYCPSPKANAKRRKGHDKGEAQDWGEKGWTESGSQGQQVKWGSKTALHPAGPFGGLAPALHLHTQSLSHHYTSHAHGTPTHSSLRLQRTKAALITHPTLQGGSGAVLSRWSGSRHH